MTVFFRRHLLLRPGRLPRSCDISGSLARAAQGPRVFGTAGAEGGMRETMQNLKRKSEAVRTSTLATQSSPPQTPVQNLARLRMDPRSHF